MTRWMKKTGTIFAASCATLLVSGAVVTWSATVIGEQLISMQRADAMLLPGKSDGTPSVNRAGKTDKLPVAAGAATRTEIKSVEVIGVTNASIVYRDRDGNILFRTDPLANVTVVSKNVDLPEVTIRESDAAKVDRVPVEEATPGVKPHGCESAFARPSPESLTRLSSRCVTDLSAPARRFAANETAAP